MSTYHYQTVFDDKRASAPAEYSAYEDELVGDPSSTLDDEIKECEEILSDDSLNPTSEDQQFQAMLTGLPLICIKYTPNKTRYQFIEEVLTKVERSSAGWGTSYDLTDERIGEIYDQMVSSAPIGQVLSKFTIEELSIYGW